MSVPNLSSRLRGAFIGLAVLDALGGPVEFCPRGSFPKVTNMLPNRNFDLPAGCFTDDTSMALCLASSLLENGGQTNVLDQVRKYNAWHSEGYMSSIGWCFDIGVTTSAALQTWSKYLRQEHDHLRPDSEEAIVALTKIEQKIDNAYNAESFCGNGGLMRVLPVSLIARHEEDAVSLAAASSKITHPHARCVDAVKIYAILVHRALEGMSKEGLVSSISNLVQNGHDFRVEAVLRDRLVTYKDLSSWRAKTVSSIRSTGYVVDSLEASLWAFFTTDSFEEGAIKVVNLGDDADTVGAIYGGLAGAFYGFESVPELWLSAMKNMAMLEEMVEKIIAFRTNMVSFNLV